MVLEAIRVDEVYTLDDMTAVLELGLAGLGETDATLTVFGGGGGT